VVVRSAAVLDQRLALAVHSAVIRLSVASRHPGEGPQPVRDLDAIRGFLTGAGPIAIVDLPWVPVFLTICFLIHPWLGVASTIGAVSLFTMTLLTERASRAPAKALAQDAGRRAIMVEAQRRSGETIMAMGMGGALAQRWAGVNNRYIAATASLSDVAGGFGSASKVLRLLLQSVILGLGAYLVIRQELTDGAPSSRRGKASPGCRRRSRAPPPSARSPRCHGRRAVSMSSMSRWSPRAAPSRWSRTCASP
jgi:ATP-binding cassette subfamily C protein